MYEGNDDEAKRYYENALRIHFPFPEAHQNLANTYESKGDYISALKHHHLSVLYAKTLPFKAAAIVNAVLAELKLLDVRRKDDLIRLLSLLGDF